VVIQVDCVAVAFSASTEVLATHQLLITSNYLQKY